MSYTNGLSRILSGSRPQAGNEVISRTEHDGETADTIFFLYDANLNVNAIVDEDGELVKTFDYEEFGGTHPASVAETKYTNTNAENNKLLFAGGVGHPTDDSGLVYMRARYYDPASGRFVSEDPGQNGTNWYAYCLNNPVNGVDPTGQDFASVVDVLVTMSINSMIGTVTTMAADAMYQILMIWTGQRDRFSTKELSAAAYLGLLAGLVTPVAYTPTSLYALYYQSAVAANNGCGAGMIAAFAALTGENDFIGGFMDALGI